MKKLALIALAGVCPGFAASAAILTSDTTIATTNANYDGADIVVIGCTVTVEGLHTFSDVLVIENGVITYSPTTNTTNAGLDLNVSNNVVIEAGSAIVADGLGYGPGSGPGAGVSTTDTLPFGVVYTNGGGGGFGGNGGPGVGGASGGRAYGSLYVPVNPGSGGGNGAGPGGAGGGIVQLNIGGALVVDGQITANGGNGLTPASGGGSGGEISITVPSISGVGIISADGGLGEPSEGGGGGGGRIKISVTTNDFAGALTAHGGTGANAGGAGTIYVAPLQAQAALLLIDNGGLSGPETPLVNMPTQFDLIVTNGATASVSQQQSIGALYIASNSVVVWSSGGSFSAQTLTIETNAALIPTPFTNQNLQLQGGGTLFGQDDVNSGGGGGNRGLGGASAFGAGGGGATLEGALTGSVGGPGGNMGGAGGGVFSMKIAGVARIDGQISANGGPGIVSGSGGGAGGGVNLSAGTLTGSGIITANGGSGQLPWGGGGGGGLVSVLIGTGNRFSGTIAAYGGAGANGGGAGIVVVRTNNGIAQVIVDNDGLAGAETAISAVTVGIFDLSVLHGAVAAPSFFLSSCRNLLIGSNAFVTVQTNNQQNNQQTLGLGATGNATIQATGGIDIDGKGFPPRPGQGHGGGGGSNGGIGGSGAGEFMGPVSIYGLGSQPTPGQGGQYIPPNLPLGGYGGGAIELTVGGQLFIQGQITANGQDGLPPSGGGGAGGSISIQTGGLSGDGSITANGGAGNLPDGGGGGGGRIAIMTKSNQFTGLISARGGTGFNPGGAGTIYTTAPNALGTVTIDNGGTSNGYTFFPQGPAVNAILQGGSVLKLGYPGIVAPGSMLFNSLVIGSNSFIVGTNVPLTIRANSDVTIEGGGGIILDGVSFAQNAAAGRSIVLDGGGHTGGGGANAGNGGTGLGGAPGGQAVTMGVTQPETSGGTGGSGEGNNLFVAMGGGIVNLSVGGTLEVDGVLSANGAAATTGWGGGAAGGSVEVTASSVTGTGTISANGGSGGPPNGGGGGGGRVAIVVKSNAFTGVISAYGGAGYVAGGAGTVYLSDGNETPQLRIDNGGVIGAGTPTDSIWPSSVDLTIANGASLEPRYYWTIKDLLVESNGLVRQLTNRTVLTITGDAEVAVTAGISADGGGWDSDTGPGAGTTASNVTSSGGGYGGRGGASQGGAPGGDTNGSAEAPTAWGSGGGVLFGQMAGLSQGGGAIALNVGGKLTVDGVISANGSDAVYPGAGGGSGGSVWLTTSALAGSGLIAANGGAGQDNLGGGGGGGRIAIYSPSNEFAGQITVAGGGGFAAGGEGSIYLTTNTTAPKIVPLTLPALGILPPTIPTELTLTWAGSAGATYQVQSSTDLIHWEAFGGAISGNAGMMNVTLTPGSGDQQQYFRLLLVN